MSAVTSVVVGRRSRYSFIALLFLLWASNGSSYSGISVARVRQAGDVPCFAIPDRSETRKYANRFSGIKVYRVELSSKEAIIWEIETMRRTPKGYSDVFITPEQCVAYGSVPEGMATVTVAQPLKSGVLYRVHISASTTHPRGSPFGGSHHNAFCLVKTADRGILVKEYDEGPCP